MSKLSQLETIGVKFNELLQQAGIEDQVQLLHLCRQRQGRESLAKETGINIKLIAKWTTYADLARIHGVGEDYAELLEHIGVLSVQELAQWQPEKLFQSLQTGNEQNDLVRQLPALSQIKSWVTQALRLPPLLE